MASGMGVLKDELRVRAERDIDSILCAPREVGLEQGRGGHCSFLPGGDIQVENVQWGGVVTSLGQSGLEHVHKPTSLPASLLLRAAWVGSRGAGIPGSLKQLFPTQCSEVGPFLHKWIEWQEVLLILLFNQKKIKGKRKKRTITTNKSISQNKRPEPTHKWFLIRVKKEVC